MAGIRIEQDDDTRGFPPAEAVEAELIEPMPVPATPAQSRTRYTDRPVRPSANFIAQLMAIEGGYQQTRGLFGAEPDQATAAYRTALVCATGRTRRMS
ncbi:hypothetical protein [Rhodopseudomonas palustris]|uniref:Uncharacterized protein n=1 Tax=Rhodopseudomonas palustris TaxID=1076 RepID=A0A418VI06_RHOPL|nr:hypothetical protein [Rhodopseudomonas palustris]RJF75780.1 hypothetical protein D4Q52_08455 [Rhodopseudomonas palustris]